MLYYYSIPIRILAAAALIATPILLVVLFFYLTVNNETRFFQLFLVYMFLFPPLAMGCFWGARTLLVSVTDESVIAHCLALLSNVLLPLAMYFGVPAVLLSLFVVAYYWQFNRPLFFLCATAVAVVVAVAIRIRVLRR